jgi:hypothetical protein
MVPLRNPHRLMLWGSFFVCLPILFAAIHSGSAMFPDGSMRRFGIRRRVAS